MFYVYVFFLIASGVVMLVMGSLRRPTRVGVGY